MRKTYNSNQEAQSELDKSKGKAFLKSYMRNQNKVRKSFRDEEISYRDKMNIVINQNNYNNDLKKKF